ncbi:MAG TPA: electron transfer flavoprotein subunit beta/FixA family protein [Polyangiaceae bacterium]|nr:electron transfer flavoprotein subunit beta/FixA family protein [Polyangiaceae bacterium]
MKILVAVKRVADPDNANRIKVGPTQIDTTGLEWKINPFDEYALEAALRLTEDGAKNKDRLGEVIVVTLGPPEADATLRSALATGADRAIRVNTSDAALDGRLVAKALAKVVEQQAPDLVLMGKQAVDGDSNFVAQALAELIDYPMATFAATIKQEASGVLVGREVDGGTMNVRLRFPALVSVDLRIVAPDSVYSSATAPTFKYNEGVRFAPLPAIMKAKKKPLDVLELSALVGGATLATQYVKFTAPAGRKAGVKVASVAELVAKLKNDARVL